MALYSIITAILQGIGGQWYGIAFLVIAIIIKYLGNIILIPIFLSNGASIATMVAYTFCICASLYVIKKKTGLRLGSVFRRLTAIVVFSFIMALVVGFTNFILSFIVDYEANRMISLVYVILGGLVGMVTYFALSWYFDLVTNLFGTKFSLERFKRRISRRK